MTAIPRRRSVAWLVGVGAFALATAACAQTVVQTPHGPLESFDWVALPEFGGEEAIIYRSADGTRVAAAFRESGSYTFTYPFDEFLVVTSGTATFAVQGGDTFVLQKGDVAYFEEGTTVHMTLSEDFSDVTMLIGHQPVRWR